ncbi:Zn(2)-C6 fungal-type DNA-binding domain [Phaffia rhodozyma]|uniref:Zn(2)-C6 fungal-type DNA-binding domain n=1 Tax=Phaffia rhodozyma TaxID=264483 RepID=A0A0F7SWH6_PHARH|nr:Zn(2)-C6 fungal-type DNA-binding domain [Phaffia rhodozyma]
MSPRSSSSSSSSYSYPSFAEHFGSADQTSLSSAASQLLSSARTSIDDIGSDKDLSLVEKPKGERIALRRNFACHRCRRRKLKCDSKRPICSPCEKVQASYLANLPEGVPVPDPNEIHQLCTYDHLEGPFKRAITPPTATSRKKESKDMSNSKSKATEVSSTSSSSLGPANHTSKDEPNETREHRQLEQENLELRRKLSLLEQSLARLNPNQTSQSKVMHLPSLSIMSGNASRSEHDHHPPPPPTGYPHSSLPSFTHQPYSTHHPSWFEPYPSSAGSSQRRPYALKSPKTILPPLLPALQPLPRSVPNQHLHYPFISLHQEGLFKHEHPSDLFEFMLLDGMSPKFTLEEAIHRVGGVEVIEHSVRLVMSSTALMADLYPPFRSRTTLESEVGLSLLHRARLPPWDPLSMHPSLVLAVCGFAHRTSKSKYKEAEGWITAAGRALTYCRFHTSDTPNKDTDARKRERYALDCTQAAIMLAAYYHQNGCWAQFHMFAPLATHWADLFGLVPRSHYSLPEYTVDVLPPPENEEIREERIRTAELARFALFVHSYSTARGSSVYLNFTCGQNLKEMTRTVLQISVYSSLLVAKVDSFNRTLWPPIPPASPNGTLLTEPAQLDVFRRLELDVDAWVKALGELDSTDPEHQWSDNRGMGELLGGKILAEHARLLLYYVHLDQGSSNAQRKACLAAAQSISQSCLSAAVLRPTIMPSYCLHSYFLAAQVLLRFAAVMDMTDVELAAQLHRQIQDISDTFARLSECYLVAHNLNKLLQVAMRDGPSAIPRSQAMIVSRGSLLDRVFHEDRKTTEF